MVVVVVVVVLYMMEGSTRIGGIGVGIGIGKDATLLAMGSFSHDIQMHFRASSNYLMLFFIIIIIIIIIQDFTRKKKSQRLCEQSAQGHLLICSAFLT